MNPKPKDLPDIYFETTVGRFNTAPQEVKRLGGLSKKWKTSEVNRIEVGPSGGYMAWDADRRPHCQEPRSKRNQFGHLAKTVGAKLNVLSSKSNHVKAGDLVVLNHGTAEYSKAMPSKLLSLLRMEPLFHRLHRKLVANAKDTSSVMVSDRGNLAISSAWASLNQKLKPDKDVTSPQMLANTTVEDVGRMIAMTKIIRNLSKYYGFDEPFSTDNQRTNEFANYLCEHFDLPTRDSEGRPNNTIEGLTCALTCCDPPMLNGEKTEPFLFGTHVDQYNCSHPGFNVLFCYYEHFQKDGRWYRVSVIAYSRAVVSHFYRRKDSKNFLKSHLTKYIQHCFGSNRGTAPMDAIPFPSDPDHKSNPPYRSNHMIPVMDKLSGFYSPAVSALRRIMANNPTITLETMCELILPIGWATTFSHMYPLLMEWAENGLPQSSNLSVFMIEELVSRHGSFVGGAGPRFQPSFNFSVPMKNMKESLRILRSTIMDINAGNFSPSDKNLKRRLSGIFQLGNLGSMHILHVAAACRVIHNVDFIASAHIAKGTTTWKRVSGSFHLGETVLNRMIADIADELSLPQQVIENALCEYCRDNDVNKPFHQGEYETNISSRRKENGKVSWPDIFFEQQSIYTLQMCSNNTNRTGNKRSCDGVIVASTSRWEILESTFVVVDGQRIVTKSVIPPWEAKPNDRTTSWLDPSLSTVDDLRAIRVSTKSRLRGEDSENSDKKRKRLFKRKKVVHTGMGVHVGLEARLEESDKRRMQVSDPAYQMFMEFQMDPTFGYSLKSSIKTSLRANYRHTTRGAQRLSKIICANSSDNTYRRIDLKSLCLAILSRDGRMPSGKTMRKKISKYFRTEELPPVETGTWWEDDVDLATKGYTASIHWHSMSALFALGTDSALSDVNFVCYRKRRAYYKTREDAINAVIIRTLVKVATMSEENGIDPAWSRRLLPDDRMADRSTSHVALYQNAGANDRLVGMLSFRGDKRLLSIPRDVTDLTRPWQDFLFDEYPHKG